MRLENAWQRPVRPLRPAAAIAVALLCAGALGAGAQSRPATRPAPPARTQPAAVWSKDRYVVRPAVVDPESMAYVLGRRTNAPLVRKPFRGGTRSLAELGRTVCRLLAKSHTDSLLALAVQEDEFRDILWREFPQSRPITGLKWDDGWIPLTQRLQAGCSGAVGDHGGRRYEFVRFEVDSVAEFKNFRIHMGLTLVARDEQGKTGTMRWLRAVAERKGRYKIYSTSD